MSFNEKVAEAVATGDIGVGFLIDDSGQQFWTQLLRKTPKNLLYKFTPAIILSPSPDPGSRPKADSPRLAVV